MIAAIGGSVLCTVLPMINCPPPNKNSAAPGYTTVTTASYTWAVPLHTICLNYYAIPWNDFHLHLWSNVTVYCKAFINVTYEEAEGFCEKHGFLY